MTNARLNRCKPFPPSLLTPNRKRYTYTSSPPFKERRAEQSRLCIQTYNSVHLLLPSENQYRKDKTGRTEMTMTDALSACKQRGEEKL